MTNPMQMMGQGNPFAKIIQGIWQSAKSNPQAMRFLQRTQGKSDMEFRRMAQNYAEQRGLNLRDAVFQTAQRIAPQYGVNAQDILNKLGI